VEGRQRRSFTEEYKRQAAELVLSSGRSITPVAKELGLRDSVLRRWVEKLRQEPAIGGAAACNMPHTTIVRSCRPPASSDQ
jgi:transposase-like protein